MQMNGGCYCCDWCCWWRWCFGCWIELAVVVVSGGGGGVAVVDVIFVGFVVGLEWK